MPARGKTSFGWPSPVARTGHLNSSRTTVSCTIQHNTLLCSRYDYFDCRRASPRWLTKSRLSRPTRPRQRLYSFSHPSPLMQFNVQHVSCRACACGRDHILSRPSPWLNALRPRCLSNVPGCESAHAISCCRQTRKRERKKGKKKEQQASFPLGPTYLPVPGWAFRSRPPPPRPGRWTPARRGTFILFSLSLSRCRQLLLAAAAVRPTA